MAKTKGQIPDTSYVSYYRNNKFELTDKGLKVLKTWGFTDIVGRSVTVWSIQPGDPYLLVSITLCGKDVWSDYKEQVQFEFSEAKKFLKRIPWGANDPILNAKIKAAQSKVDKLKKRLAPVEDDLADLIEARNNANRK